MHGADAPAGRPASVDLLLGIALVLLLLDHTREFFHAGAFLRDPTNLGTTTPGLFLTRWITHFGAPVFLLLMGASVAFELQRGAARGATSVSLLVRGLLLVLLEVTVVRFGMFFNADYGVGTALQLFWVLGIGMIVLAAMIHLPVIDIAVTAFAVIAGHNAFDHLRAAEWSGPGTPLPGLGHQLWTVIHQPGLIAGAVFVVYPLIPWIVLPAAGYAIGTLWSRNVATRRRRLVQLGVACLVGFVLLRALNLYGDPLPWSVQSKGAVYSALSFVNVMKYPPSLLYLLLTIGPALLLLAWLEPRPGESRDRSAPARALMTLGAVPILCYVLQWYVPHLLSWGAHLAAGMRTEHMTLGPAAAPSTLAEVGFPLPVVYGAWLVSLVLIYLVCHWIARMKQRRAGGWLRYL